MEKINLLLVENSEEKALQVANYLGEISRLAIDINYCETLEESYSLLRKEHIDIILMNLILPDGYGIQSFAGIFLEFPNIPCIVLTELDDDTIAAEIVKSGAQDYITKETMNSDTLFKSISYSIERKQFEKDLRKSEEKYRQLFSRSKDAIYISTPDGRFIDFNPSGLKLFGYTEEELPQLKVRALYANETDRDRLQQVLAEKEQVTDYELLLTKKDRAADVHCLLSSMAIYNEDRTIRCYQGIIKDITEKKKAQEALFQSLADLDIANKELHLLNETLEYKVEERTQALKHEKEIVEQNSKEINESIQYAKRIQASILPPMQRLKNEFLDSFVYYEPKDVVSGDFYWYEKIKNNPLFAVVDCTGHGVPGAFMSIIGYTQLNEIVNQQVVTDPGVILQELDKRVRTALHQNTLNSKNSKDGMELGLIHVNRSQNTLEFAGAMRPLYLVRNGELKIYKGSKFSIGGISLREKQFETIRIEIQPGDSFYVFSDGYPDQFGGPNGKKFMTRNVADMLRSIAHLNMVEQEKIVKQTIDTWMTNEEQVDDILICGIKF